MKNIKEDTVKGVDDVLDTAASSQSSFSHPNTCLSLPQTQDENCHRPQPSTTSLKSTEFK